MIPMGDLLASAIAVPKASPQLLPHSRLSSRNFSAALRASPGGKLDKSGEKSNISSLN
jgi:hypothetical protein